MAIPGSDVKNMKSKLHVVMFPWVAFGHFIPYLELSKKLAERGHRVSFILPKSALAKLEQLNQYPNLIHFYPLVIPHVDGLPAGAETNSDVAFPLLPYLFRAFDQTQPQVESYLCSLNPDLVIYDLAYWIPPLGRTKYGFKSISYAMACVVMQAFYVIPSRWMNKDKITVEELTRPPPGFPSSSIHLKHHEAALALPLLKEDFGSGLSFFDRLIRSRLESDAIAVRTCREIEGSLCDYVAPHFAKPVLVVGPALPETPAALLEDKWAKWLNNFEAGSVVYCAFGSQVILQTDQFQQLVLGFELTGLPFLVALTPPNGCATIEEAMPEGFEERVQGRGWVYGGWVPQPSILQHPSVGCFVSHCGHSSMWESLLSDCQIVLIPQALEQVLATKLLVEELKVAVEVERGENMCVPKEDLSKAINLVMDKNGTVSRLLKSNHDKLRSILSRKDLQESYTKNLIQSLEAL